MLAHAEVDLCPFLDIVLILKFASPGAHHGPPWNVKFAFTPWNVTWKPSLIWPAQVDSDPADLLEMKMREVTGFRKGRGAQHVGAIPLWRSVEVYELWTSGVQVWEEALL